LAFQLSKRGSGPEVQPELTRAGPNAIVASTIWTDDDGRRVERFQVVTIRDGKIADLQGFATRWRAERYARRLGS
jgi:hypothetical protein